MREIKFRAWIKSTKKFEKIDAIGQVTPRAFPVYTKKNKYWFPMQGVLEQYTGLCDKNGVEIYENDIVRCSMGYPHKIVWVEEIGGMFVGGMPGWYLSGLDEGYAWTNSEEVIGNIHNNPELLEEL